MKNYLGILGLFIALSHSAQALPLLSETAGKLQYGTLTVYPDHQDRNKFYYFPNSTEFSRDQSGVPLFNFVYWGLTNPNPQVTPGAYMSFTTRLESDAKQKDALQKFTQDHPTASVAVLPIMKSTIGLTSSTGGAPLGALFSEFDFSKVAGRAEDEIGINAVLNGSGARAFKSLLLNAEGGSPIKFDYCYTIQGLGPNMDATIDVDMRNIYDHFSAASTGSFFWFSYQIRTELEKLQQDKHIVIRMNGGDAKEWEYLDAIAEEITKRLFQPVLLPTAGEAISNRPFSFGASYVHKEELSEEHWTWVRQDLVEREFCTAVNVKDLGSYKDKLIVDSDKN